ncbi:MAG TPA: IPT/TIG domain-containing protein [Thermoanaerobaculia bacterium]|nr:IPT/TIG domain-containing protein [Thermoanaerobaculia bacterium]
MLAAQSTISTITPSSGLTRGGVLVDIRGTNLLAAECPGPNCKTFVTFGGSFATIVFNTADEIVVVAPAHASGAVDVVISIGGALPVVVTCGFTFQTPAEGENVRFLLPISGGITGVLNTTWRTDVSVTNENAIPVTIAGTAVPPLTTKTLLLSGTSAFVDIPRELSDGVTISVRVQDTTHDADSLGVDVPAVPPSQFRKSVVLTSLPSDPRYRMLLRIYGYGGPGSAIVRIRDANTGALLDQMTADLTGSSPSYAQIALSASASVPRTVEVTTAGRSDPPIWAFVSVTNNITQQVTLATPRVGVAGSASSDAPLLATGHWGGNGCMEVSEQDVFVGATCSFGSFPRPVLEADGHFEADGKWFGPSVGPLPPLPISDPAHFSGMVQGSKLALVVRTGSRVLGPFLVELGSSIPCSPACP